MQHLSAERLAALADEEPTTVEREHLTQCGECARERAAHRSVVAFAIRERESLPLPLTRWETLAPMLRAEGLVAAKASAGTPRVTAGASRRRWLTGRGWMQAAAAVLLVATGLVAGRYSAGASPVPGMSSAFVGDSARQLAELLRDTLPAFQSPTQALAALAQYERAYQSAAAYLAAHDTSSRLGERADFEARLATLDQVAAATREGLQQTPYDPVINRYYLSTLGARQATLQQLSTSLPPDVRVGEY